MTWTGIGASGIPSYGDLEDGVTNDYLQRLGTSPPDTTIMPFVGDSGLAVYSLYGLTTTPGDWPARSDYEAARFWNPSSNAVTGLSAVTGGGLDRVVVSWTDDTGIPSADSGWARTDTEIAVFRSTSATGTYSEIGTSNYGDGSYHDRDISLTSGVYYYYKVQYRSKTDATAVGALSSYVSAQAS